MQLSGEMSRRAPAWDTASMASVTLLYWLSHTMLRPLVAPFAARVGAGAAEIGVILAAHALPAFALAIPTGLAADRLGYRKLLLGGSALMGVGGAVMVTSASVPQLVLAQALIGVGALGVWLAIQGLMIASRSSDESRETRDRRITNYSMLVIVGQLSGPVFGGVLADAWSYRVAFTVFAVIVVVMLGSSVGVRNRPPAAAEAAAAEGATAPTLRARDVARSYREAGLLLRERGVMLTMAVSFGALFLLDVRTAFHPLYFDDVGLSSSMIGTLLSTAGACALLARPILPWMLRRFRPGTVAMSCLVPGAASVGGVALFEHIGAIFALMAVSGMTLGLAQPLTLALTADYTSAGQRGMGIGLRLMANRTAQWVNPALFGALLASAGFTVAFGTVTAMIATLSVVVGLMLNWRSARKWQE